MIPVAISILIGYLLGSLSPAALISKIKKKNLRDHGTGNLGASNTMLIFGKGLGALVMVFDVFKAFFASRLAKLLFPTSAYVSLIAGLSAQVGHVFPFYMKFKGGKGLASFGGLVLAHDPMMFFTLLINGCILMLIFNYSAVMPMSVGILFPVWAGLKSGDLTVFLIALTAGVLVIIMHASNLVKGRQGKDINIRDYIRTKLFAKTKT